MPDKNVKGRRTIQAQLVGLTIFLVLMTLTGMVWHSQVEHDRIRLLRHTENICLQAAQRMGMFMDLHLRVVRVFARRWSSLDTGDFSRHRFEEFSAVILKEMPGFSAFGLVPQEGQRTGWVYPEGIPFPRRLDPPRPAERAANASSPESWLIGPEPDPSGRAAFWAVIQLSRAGSPMGTLLAEFPIATLVQGTFHPGLRSEFDFVLRDGEQILYRSAQGDRAIDRKVDPFLQSSNFAVQNRIWTLSVVPKTPGISWWGGISHLPVLLLGSLFAFGVSLLVYLLARRLVLFRKSREQQALLSRKVLKAQEEERSRVSRELHDELGQLLTALRLEMGWLQGRVSTLSPKEELDVFGNAIGLVEQSTEELRHICRGLRPPLLDDLGLEPAARQLIEEFQGRCDAEVRSVFGIDEREGVITPELALCTYRILQESLTNIGRHALAKSVTVQLLTTTRELTLNVVDDGQGFDVARLGALQGCGLEGMQERAALVGGSVEIQSARKQGTRISFRARLSR